MLAFIVKYKPFFDFLAVAIPFIILPRGIIFKQQDAYEKLASECSTLSKEYIEKMGDFMDNKKPTFKQLASINHLGGLYFDKLTMLCDRVLEGILNNKTLNNSFFPKIKRIVELQLIETHYSKLNIQAEKLTGRKDEFGFQKEMYKSIFEIYDKFIKGNSFLTDYRLKPLRYIWQKVQCLLIPALVFFCFQALVYFPTHAL